ncbi:hypothetical protein OKA05_27260 [Luteolibacter arcticus]|uniref:DUF1320 domain-containing protein n=1 Tax=Luteolibacter arcticus TaxID=1581411 RepID=A0ABT3GS44_9BACT|nr:hypothetical protein [Luteolibacter arcticus]MCW1926283.1 hypothetical protein [Luteolibacter arcticus]
MSWVALSSTHVLARLTTDERDAFEAVGEAASTDKLSGIIAQVAALVRSKVATFSGNTPGDEGTIPAGALYHAVSLCRAALVAAQPTMEGSTDQRAEETRQAYLYLDQVAKGEVLVTSPDGVYPVTVAEATGSYGGKVQLDF